MSDRLRLGFLCAHDPYDRNSFSGTPSYMLDALQRCGSVELRVLGPWRPGLWGRILRKLRKRMGAKVGVPRASEMAGLDWVIIPVSSHLVAAHPEGAPGFVHVTDATPQFLRDFYNYDIPPESDKGEAAAIGHAAKVIYSSDFMARRAISEFGAQYAPRIHAVSFGLNLETLPPPPEPKPAPQPFLQLLFVGRDWQRKGGDVALAATEALNRRGIPTRLTVIGCDPGGLDGRADIEVIPFLDKNRPEDYARLTRAFAEAHFFILPTRADCTPMVVAEANAYGTPVLISDIGGISSLIEPGQNGEMLPPDADGNAYADRIAALIADPQAFEALCASSYAWCRDHLTWDAWANDIVKTLETS
ncbi:glycosyltransferase family 4 protein [Paenirhodobacter populi]|nr:glycosyltransferase family 4 protein [Sinirhodobacter populi]